jgi:hypothetical protein
MIRRNSLEELQKLHSFALLSIKRLLRAHLDSVSESTYFLADHYNLFFSAHHDDRAGRMLVTLRAHVSLAGCPSERGEPTGLKH